SGLTAGLDPSMTGQHFSPTPDFNRRRVRGKLRDHHFAAVQFLAVVTSGIFPPRQPVDSDPVLECLDDDVIATDPFVPLIGHARHPPGWSSSLRCSSLKSSSLKSSFRRVVILDGYSTDGRQILF